ncbi:MAG: GNAT family N-acetyltransferase [Bacteroidota bacterium]
MTIRLATDDDAPRLSDIAWAAKQHWGYPAGWMEAWRSGLTFTPAYIAAHRVFVAELEGVPAGCCALEGTTGEIQLEHLWIDPAYFGRGIGKALFHHAAQAARDAGATRLCIHSDPNASGFYERMGATLSGSVPAHTLGHTRRLPVYTFDLRPAPL